METDSTKFTQLSVELLLEAINIGKIQIEKESLQNSIAALTYDDSGKPDIASITAELRAAAKFYAIEAAKERAAELSPFNVHLPPAVPVTHDILSQFQHEAEYSELAFNLYRETSIIATLCGTTYTSKTEADGFLERNQAICAGLLIRIGKFMLSTLQLTAESHRGEVVMALQRCIAESAINLLFLLDKNDPAMFNEFVRLSLSPEREIYDTIQKNIADRNGEVLPIETRILASTASICKASSVPILDVNAKYRDWGGGIKVRLRELGMECAYASLQRVPSHAVHGTWVDLVTNHLEEKEGKFRPNTACSDADPRHFLPLCRIVLDAAFAYVDSQAKDSPELGPLAERVDELVDRLDKVDQAFENFHHTEWTNRRNNPPPS